MRRPPPLSSYCPSRIFSAIGRVFGINVAVKMALYEVRLGIGVDSGSVFAYIGIKVRETITPHFRELTSRTGPRRGISLTFFFALALS